MCIFQCLNCISVFLFDWESSQNEMKQDLFIPHVKITLYPRNIISVSKRSENACWPANEWCDTDLIVYTFTVNVSQSVVSYSAVYFSFYRGTEHIVFAIHFIYVWMLRWRCIFFFLHISFIIISITQYSVCIYLVFFFFFIRYV